MALNTTIGSKTATSLCTVAEADAYIAAGPYPTAAWTALTTAQKEERLIMAANFMRNSLSWAGWELHLNQRLPFPRVLAKARQSRYPWQIYDLDRGAYSTWWTDDELAEFDVIPDDIKKGQAYLAYAVMHCGLTQVSNPASGPVDTPEIGSLSLFGSLSVSTRSDVAARGDSSIFQALLRSQYFNIYLLFSDWLAQIVATPAPLIPSQLAEVA